jgi:hypothetical protein
MIHTAGERKIKNQSLKVIPVISRQNIKKSGGATYQINENDKNQSRASTAEVALIKKALAKVPRANRRDIEINKIVRGVLRKVRLFRLKK